MVQVLHAANRHVPVRMNRVGMVVKRFHHRAVRRIVKAQAALLLHHLPFVVEDFLVDLQIAHAVRFQPQDHGQHVAGHRLPKDRGVLGGVSVVRPAGTNDVVGEFVGAEVLRPVEHQVLKEVREAGPAGNFILRAHVIPNLHVDHRRVVALHNQRAQAVIEFHFVDFGVRKLDGGSRGRLENQPERRRPSTRDTVTAHRRNGK